MLSQNLKYLGTRVLLGFSISTQILFPSVAFGQPSTFTYRFEPRNTFNINTISECLNRAERVLQTQGMTNIVRLRGEGTSRSVFGRNNYVTAGIECVNASTVSGKIWIIVSSNDFSQANTYKNNIFDEMQIP